MLIERSIEIFRHIRFFFWNKRMIYHLMFSLIAACGGYTLVDARVHYLNYPLFSSRQREAIRYYGSSASTDPDNYCTFGSLAVALLNERGDLFYFLVALLISFVARSQWISQLVVSAKCICIGGGSLRTRTFGH